MQKFRFLGLTLIFSNQIRIAENNDWVMFILLGCGFLYIFMMISLQRDASIREFLLQEFTVSANGFLSWLVTMAVFSLALSAFISQYIPIVPKILSDYPVFGYQLNKFGYTFVVILFFYFLKAVFTYFFYQSTGASRKWAIFYFTITKFYFVWSLVIMILCVFHYYFSIDKKLFFPFYLGFLALGFVFKIFYYLLHKNSILPNEWYHKFLYICALQIIPLLVLWRLLFF